MNLDNLGMIGARGRLGSREHSRGDYRPGLSAPIHRREENGAVDRTMGAAAFGEGPSICWRALRIIPLAL